MPTDCSADLLGFAPVEGREVVAAFDGGAITSDAGGLLLSATDRALDLMRRLTACFSDVRKQRLVEHEVVTLIAQRVQAVGAGAASLDMSTVTCERFLQTTDSRTLPIVVGWLPIAQVLGLDPTDKAHAAKIKGVIKIWLGTEMLREVEGQDEKRRKKTFIEVGKWAND
jgi:Transposase DDE domain group 1